MMYDCALLPLYCSSALSTVNCHTPCASTEGQKILNNAVKYLSIKENLLGKKLLHFSSTNFNPYTKASKNYT